MILTILFFAALSMLALTIIVLSVWMFAKASEIDKIMRERERIRNPYIPDTLDAIDWGKEVV